MSDIAEVAAEGLATGPVPRRPRLAARVLRTPTGVVGVLITLCWLAVGVAAPALAPYDPFAIEGSALGPPSAVHPLGTDALGRDLLSGVVWGARTSLVVAAGVAVLALLIGTVVGLVSGYLGGWLDDVLMRSTEVFQVLPRFFLALVVIAFFGPGLDRLVLVLGVTSWPLLARVVRAEVFSLRHREFVDAARVHGASTSRILVREILPNALPPAVALLGLVVAQVILIEASLGFLGLGDPNVTSWGALASEAQRFLRAAWWLSVFPGLAILLAVLGLNLLGDAVTDAASGRR
ncbi:ABC transporter permease [Blastococcus mobilis]|uniref:Peptide/nickel transport system permease protein n=1 Tax=Blastococcus mobilis TaxID=1938746 RepID=A0A238ZEM9_9ACTN|nr:ABC transporter permease [Blastococcus mobilis]SNR81976.1 peptide/nickel transport system permease protein [Blastococcus mobilis]